MSLAFNANALMTWLILVISLLEGTSSTSPRLQSRMPARSRQKSWRAIAAASARTGPLLDDKIFIGFRFGFTFTRASFSLILY